MLSIGSFSKVANITTKTLRYYDEIGLLKPCYVDSDSGYRYYDVTQLETVLLIGRLKAYDFSLDEIARVLQGRADSALLLELLADKKARTESLVASYADMLIQIGEDISNLERGSDIMSYLNDISVKLTETKPMTIVFIREKMNVKDYGKYMRGLYERIAEEKLTPLGAPISIYHSEEFTPESYDVEIAVPVKEAVKGTRDFPGALCAKATLKGAYDGIPSVYAKIREWMEQEGYTIAGACFEVYLTNPAETPEGENLTEVYIPVRKLA